MKEDISPLLLNLSHFYVSLLPPSECEFSGNIWSQEELGVYAAGFGPAVHPAAVPGAGPTHQGVGPKG